MITDNELLFGTTAVAASTPIFCPTLFDQQYVSDRGKIWTSSPTSELHCVVDIDSAFANPANPANGCEFTLASTPLSTGIEQAATGVAASNSFTFDNGDAAPPRSTPVYIATGDAGTSGVAVNTVFYVRPLSATSFDLHLTAAATLTSAAVAVSVTGDSAVTFAAVPVSHGSTGFIPSVRLIAASQIAIKINPMFGRASGSGAVGTVFPTIDTTGEGQWGAGTINAVAVTHFPMVQRYLGLLARPSASTSTTGITARLVSCSGSDARQVHPSGFTIISN